MAEVFLASTRILQIAVLPGEEEIAVGTRSGLFFVRLTRTDDGPSLELITKSASDKPVFGVAHDPNWDRIVGGRFDGNVVAFDRPEPGDVWEGRTLYTLFDPDFADLGEKSEIPASISAFELRQLPDGTSRAFLASFNHFAVAIDLAKTSAIEVWPAYFDKDTELTSIDVDKNGSLVLVADLDGRIFLIDGESGQLTREIRSYRTDPASLAVDGSGKWGFARPDILGKVAIDLHPSGLFFGVSSHDRTTKLFDTGDVSGGGISAVVHDHMAREVRFSSDGITGYSMSDDGSLQRFRLFETYEFLRVRGVDRGRQLSPDTDTLILTPGDGSPLRWSPDLGIRKIPGLPAAPRNWKALPRTVGNLIFFGADTRLFTVTSHGAEALCEGRTVEDLLELNENEDIRAVYPLGSNGPLLFAPVDVDSGTIRLVLFKPGTCSGAALSRTDYPEDAKIVTSESAAAIIPEPSRAILWRDVANGGEMEEIVAEGTEILGLAVGGEGSQVMAIVSQGARRNTPCLCGSGWSHAFASKLESAGSACEALASAMDCRQVDAPTDWPDGRVGTVHASPSGRFFVVRGADARLGLLEVPRWPWQRPAIRPIAPRQTRPISAPFAFSKAEDALAVPNGDTGIRIVDPSDLSVLSILSTPSRVYSLSFNGADLLSSDGANEDAIFRVQPWLPEDILARACAYWPKGSLATTAAGVPELRPRSAFCED